MARKRFQAQTRAFQEKVERLTLGIYRESVEKVAELSNIPIAQGGKMPVDTGFLRNSQAASTSGMPGTGAAPASLVAAGLQKMQPVWIGWTASYARFMEARYGFMRSAQQNWPRIVSLVASVAVRRYRRSFR